MIETELKFNNAKRCVPNASTRGRSYNPQPRRALHALRFRRFVLLREIRVLSPRHQRHIFHPFPRAETGAGTDQRLVSFQSVSTFFKALQRPSKQKMLAPPKTFPARMPASCSGQARIPLLVHRFAPIRTRSHQFAVILKAFDTGPTSR